MRKHELIKADAWGSITSAYAKASEAQRKQLNAEVRYEVDVTDLRDQVLGIVHETFGRSDDAYFEVQARGGANHNTLRRWSDNIVHRPQLNTLRQVLLTCGYDFTVARRK